MSTELDTRTHSERERGLSIFQIESELAELMAFREECNDEERAAVDGQIAEYVKREVAKVDALRSYMKHCQVMADAAAAEVKVQSQRAHSWKTRLEYLKERCGEAMGILGKKKLEGRTGYLLLKANGGKQALTIATPGLVPEEYVLYRGWMSARAYAAIPEQIRGREDFIFEREPRQEMIRGSLEKGEHIPGARLEPRGEHVEIR